MVGGEWEQLAVGCLRHAGESGSALSRKGEVCVCGQDGQASLCSPPLPPLPASFDASLKEKAKPLPVSAGGPSTRLAAPAHKVPRPEGR